MATTPHIAANRAAPEQERLLTAEDVAELIGMTADYVYALARRNAIPVVRFGRSVRFRRSSVDGWLTMIESRGR